MSICKTVVGLLVIAVTCSSAKIEKDFYEEEKSYKDNPLCAPSKLDKGIQCRDIGKTVTIKGGLVSNTFHIMLMSLMLNSLFFSCLVPNHSIRTLNFIMCL